MLLTKRRRYSIINEDKYEHLGELIEVVSNEILKASRGNSGTILATFFYGVSKYLSDKKECNTFNC